MVRIGEPLSLEVSVANASDDPSGVAFRLYGWRRKIDGQWVEVELKDVTIYEELFEGCRAPGRGVGYTAVLENASLIYALSPGEWRFRISYRRGMHGPLKPSEWAGLEVVGHDRNREILDGELGDEVWRAMTRVLGGAVNMRVPDVVANAFGSAVEFNQRRLGMEDAVQSLEAYGCSAIVALRARWWILRERIYDLADVSEADWAERLGGLRQSASQLLVACGPVTGACGGIAGDVLELRYLIAVLGEEPAAPGFLQSLLQLPGRASTVEASVRGVARGLRRRAGHESGQ